MGGSQAGPGQQPPSATLAAFIALCVAYLLANLSVGAMPILFGAMIDRWQLSLEQAGTVATAETAGLAIGSTLALALIARFPVTARYLVAGGLILCAAAQILTATGGNGGALLPARFLSGLCTAIVQAAAIAWISRQPSPQRPLALFMGMTFLSGTLGIPLFTFTLDQGGVEGTFLLFGGLLLAGLLLVPLLPATPLAPPTGPADVSPPTAGSPWQRLPLLAAIALNFVFNGGVWIYLERVGQTAGIDTAQIAALLGLGMFVALAGVLLLAVAGPRARDGWVIVIGHVALIVATAMLFRVDHWILFAAAVLLFHVGIALLPPATLSALARIDPSGRAALQGMAAINIGYAIGPQVYAWIVAVSGFTFSLAAAIAIFGVSLLLCLRGPGHV